MPPLALLGAPGLIAVATPLPAAISASSGKHAKVYMVFFLAYGGDRSSLAGKPTSPARRHSQLDRTERPTAAPDGRAVQWSTGP
jgi:hypothetical protein